MTTTSATIRRFDRTTRVVHWTSAGLTLVLLLTGTILYVGQLEAAVGRRALLASIHVWCGLLLPVPLLVGVLLHRQGRSLRADLHDLSWWTVADRRWLRRKTRTTPAGKFNGGQKLATAIFGGALLAQLLTGSLMHWSQRFPDDWRTGATFVHDWGYLVLFFLILGHIGKALAEPEMLKSMVTGSIPRSWAVRERPGWAAKQKQAQEHERERKPIPLPGPAR
jgi:formate dehydrogenase subunit gamma